MLFVLPLFIIEPVWSSPTYLDNETLKALPYVELEQYTEDPVIEVVLKNHEQGEVILKKSGQVETVLYRPSSTEMLILYDWLLHRQQEQKLLVLGPGQAIPILRPPSQNTIDIVPQESEQEETVLIMPAQSIDDVIKWLIHPQFASRNIDTIPQGPELR